MDTLRLAVSPVGPDSGGGLRFVAGDEPHTIPVARCVCGVYGCGMTDVTITREADRVRWD